jgi:uncharacterized protein YukE
MADIMVNHGPVDTLVGDMNQAAKAMEERFTDMMTQLGQYSEAFSGAAAEVFSEMSRNQSMVATELGSSFGTGAQALNNMHEAITDSDNRGAQILGRNG